MGDFRNDSARVQEALYSKVRLSGRGLVSINFEQLLYSFKHSRITTQRNDFLWNFYILLPGSDSPCSTGNIWSLHHKFIFSKI